MRLPPFFSIKTDRASVVGDAIIHIKELQRAVNNLKVLVEEKRCRMARSKRFKMEDEPTINMERASIKPLPLDGSLRSSRLSRKSKEAIIDVQIVDNEINIKLAQRKKGNCFLLVASLLDELQLELLQVTGGSVRDNYIFMFNAKVIIIFIVSVLNNLIALVYVEMFGISCR